MNDLIIHLGVKEEEENVHVDDFIVAIQTEFQRHLMQKFANKGICCDSTHGTTGKRTIRIYYFIKAFINVGYFLNQSFLVIIVSKYSAVEGTRSLIPF